MWPVETIKHAWAARYLRKEFTTDRAVERAVLYISGLGSYEAYLNGKKVSEDVFAPMPSLYYKRIYYNVYDVTALMASDKNTLGVILGNGRFFSMRNPGMKTFGLPRLLAQLRIEYADGSQATVVSDTSWKITSKGPIVANNEFDGEEYDARLEMEGWNTNGFDDGAWKTPDVMEAPAGKLTAQQNPNIRVQETLKPVAVFDRPDGKYILDMGQNMVGWLSVNLKGKKGKPVSMKFAELLQKDGSLYLANLRTAQVTDIYTPAEDGDFSWQPRFVYHGFRFVEVSGLDYKPNCPRLPDMSFMTRWRQPGVLKHPTRWSTRSIRTLIGESVVIIAGCRPTARNVTNVSAGWATVRQALTAKPLFSIMPSCITNGCRISRTP